MASKIGTRELLAMQPGTIIWDDKVRGFNARRQYSEITRFRPQHELGGPVPTRIGSFQRCCMTLATFMPPTTTTSTLPQLFAHSFVNSAVGSSRNTASFNFSTMASM